MVDGHVRGGGPARTGRRRGEDRGEGRRAVLLTGGTGFVGIELLARFLERTQDLVYLLVRARDSDHAAARVRSTLTCLYGDPQTFAGRIVPVAGDLEAPGLGLGRRRDRLAGELSEIVHAGASVSFDLPLEQARRINVEGTRRVLELARECERRGQLERVSVVSTAYVAGAYQGVFRETDLDVGQRPRNTYEHSKLEAERLVQQRRGQLPVTIMRPSIIVGDRRTGWTASFNVLYGPLLMFSRGAYPVIPARRQSPVDAISVDHAADAIFALRRAPEGTYHVTAGSHAATVGELIELAAERFGRRPPFMVPPPVYHRTLHPLLTHLGAPARRRQLRRSEMYFPYFAIETEYDDAGARAFLDPLGIRPSPLSEYFDRLVDFALHAKWGKRPVTRAEASSAIADAAPDARISGRGNGGRVSTADRSAPREPESTGEIPSPRPWQRTAPLS